MSIGKSQFSMNYINDNAKKRLVLQPLLQPEDKVFRLRQRKRNAGRSVVLAVVGVVTYGRGRERLKAMMAGISARLYLFVRFRLCI